MSFFSGEFFFTMLIPALVIALIIGLCEKTLKWYDIAAVSYTHLRPEDMDIVVPEEGKVVGKVVSKIFKGVHYEYLVQCKYRNYKVHTTENIELGIEIGLTIDPYDIQVMHKMEN